MQKDSSHTLHPLYKQNKALEYRTMKNLKSNDALISNKKL